MAITGLTVGFIFSEGIGNSLILLKQNCDMYFSPSLDSIKSVKVSQTKCYCYYKQRKVDV